MDEGIDWCILTNGDEWQAFRTELQGKIPVTRHVFTVRISDKDMKPAEKARLFYLFSEEANRKKEIEDYYQRRIALSGANLADQIFSDKVINQLRCSIKNATGQRLTNSEIAKALVRRLFREDVVNDDHMKAIKRMERAEKKPKKDE